MKNHYTERKDPKNKPMSASKKRAVKAHILENAKQSLYAEGIEFNDNAWNWYTHKTKNA